MSLSSNTLIHLTNKKEALIGILKEGFRIKYCLEHLKTINEELLIQSVEWAKVVEKNQELQEWARQACMELRQAETANDLIRAALRELIDEKMSNLQLFLPKPDTSLIK